MPRRSFTYLVGEWPMTHLVVGPVESLTAITTAEVLVGRLIDTLVLEGDWATGLAQESRGYAVHCVFAQKADADLLATALRVKGIGHAPGFASRREFELNAKMRKSILAVLTTHQAGRKT